MMKLVRAGKAFPNRFFVAISLLLCLSADGASAAQTPKPARTADCDSAPYKNKPPCAPESPTGRVTVFWPKLRMSNAVTRTFNSKIEVWIDKAKVGMVMGNTPLTVSLPNGPHKLELKPYDDYLENIRPTRETQITVSAQKPLYFQVVDQGFVVTASELDAPTAQAVLAGNEPKNERNASTSQAAPSGNEPKDERNAFTSLAAVFGKEDKPNATPSLPPPAGNNMKTPSELGTIYLYWPRPALGFGFLEKLATDLPVYLDGNRIGAVKLGEYLAIKVPSGEHALGLDVGLSNGRLLKQDFVLGAGSTRHFHVQNQDTFRLLEDSPEEAADYAKGLTQRQVSVQ
ncbi:MAG: PEGA domain-containing protein [Rhodomicrobium sp.]